MAATTKIKLTIPKGSTYQHRFTYLDPASQDPINLMGYTARTQFRPSVDSAQVLYEGTTENGHITVTGQEGEVTLKIPADITSAWTFNAAVFDLEIISPGGDVTRLVEGAVKVTPEVTR